MVVVSGGCDKGRQGLRTGPMTGVDRAYGQGLWDRACDRG